MSAHGESIPLDKKLDMSLDDLIKAQVANKWQKARKPHQARKPDARPAQQVDRSKERNANIQAQKRVPQKPQPHKPAHQPKKAAKPGSSGPRSAQAHAKVRSRVNIAAAGIHKKKKVTFSAPARSSVPKRQNAGSRADSGRPVPASVAGPRVATAPKDTQSQKVRLNLRDIDVDIRNEQDARVALRLANTLTRRANALLQPNGTSRLPAQPQQQPAAPPVQHTRTIIKYVPYYPEAGGQPAAAGASGALQHAAPAATVRQHAAAAPSSSGHHARAVAGPSSHPQNVRRSSAQHAYAAQRGHSYRDYYAEVEEDPEAPSDEVMEEDEPTDVKPSVAELRSYEQRSQLRRMQHSVMHHGTIPASRGPYQGSRLSR